MYSSFFHTYIIAFSFDVDSRTHHNSIQYIQTIHVRQHITMKLLLAAIAVLGTIASATDNNLRGDKNEIRRIKGKQTCEPRESFDGCSTDSSSPSCPDEGCTAKSPHCCNGVCEKILTFCNPDATNDECFSDADCGVLYKNHPYCCPFGDSGNRCERSSCH